MEQMNRNLAVLLMLVVGALSFLLGYSVSPCQAPQLKSPAAGAPAYGEAPGYGAAPGYGEAPGKAKTAAPGYND